MPPTNTPRFRAATKNNVFEVLVYEQIGADWSGAGVTAKNVKAKLDQAGKFDTIHVRINSPGGDAFEGVAVMNLLRAQAKPVHVVIDGLAASAASIIAMAGDRIEMGKGAMLMVHNAWSIAIGSAADLRKSADTLDKVSDSIADTYVARTGKTKADVTALMDAETWLSAEEAVAEGFADAVLDRDDAEQANARALAQQFNLTAFSKTPATFQADAGCECPCPECEDGDCQACTHAECDCYGCDCPDHIDAAAKRKPSNLAHYETRLRLVRG